VENLSGQNRTTRVPFCGEEKKHQPGAFSDFPLEYASQAVEVPSNPSIFYGIAEKGGEVSWNIGRTSSSPFGSPDEGF